MKKAKMSEKKYKEMIFAKAEKVKTKRDLSKLIDEISSFGHDYGTIVYGCMAAMKGAFNVVNRGKSGGITGFQAGCLGWECVREFLMINGAAKLLDYDNLLYPQYADKFEKRISSEVWKDIQKKAKERLKEETLAAPRVVEHWKSIAAGKLPFGFQIQPEH